MRASVKQIGEGAATIAAVWIGYNLVVLAEIAAGKHLQYIPYLHFPIKLFVWLMS